MSAATSPCGIGASRTDDLLRGIPGAATDIAEAIGKGIREVITRPEEDSLAVIDNAM